MRDGSPTRMNPLEKTVIKDAPAFRRFLKALRHSHRRVFIAPRASLLDVRHHCPPRLSPTLEHDWLRERARVQQQFARHEPSAGLVLDREGRELARSVDTESFFVVPAEINDVAALSSRLAPLVGMDARTLQERSPGEGSNRSSYGLRASWTRRRPANQRAQARRRLFAQRA